ncbi:hypothetical protein PYCC9005_002617 [Savitreella phatthalungensis]
MYQMCNDALLEACRFVRARPARVLDSPSSDVKNKRASVAVVIGWHSTKLENELDEAVSIEDLAEKSWFRSVEPHVLFIKRAKRESDRWNNHVALPGGRREPNETDEEAARREALEEVGLALNEDSCMLVGGLDQRVITTGFGKTFLMTLCPYVYLMRKAGLPQLKLQESEVESAHWISLDSLLDPTNRSFELVDIAGRLRRIVPWWTPDIVLQSFGQMRFCAIQLRPRSSVPPDTQTQLQMWGLTLGVMTDLLGLLPPYDAISLWQYPSFTAPDTQAVLRVLCGQASARRQSLWTIDVAKRSDGDMDYAGRAMMLWNEQIFAAIISCSVLRLGAGIGFIYAMRSIMRYAR